MKNSSRTRLAIGAIAVAASLAVAAPAAANPPKAEPNLCGAGEPAYTGWNYFDLQAYGVSCGNAHDAAEEYVYDFSTEGVIEPPSHWDRCKDKRVAKRLWKGKCKRTKDGRRQKITFLFSGPDQPWY